MIKDRPGPADCLLPQFRYVHTNENPNASELNDQPDQAYVETADHLGKEKYRINYGLCLNLVVTNGFGIIQIGAIIDDDW